jgi:hypothetical protein
VYNDNVIVDVIIHNSDCQNDERSDNDNDEINEKEHAFGSEAELNGVRGQRCNSGLKPNKN